MDGIAGIATKEGTAEGFRVIFEAEVIHDPLSVAEYFGLDTATMQDVIKASFQIREATQKHLIAHGMPPELTVYRAGALDEPVISVHLKELSVEGEANPYSLLRKDVLCWVDSLTPGSFTEDELLVYPDALRPGQVTASQPDYGEMEPPRPGPIAYTPGKYSVEVWDADQGHLMDRVTVDLGRSTIHDDFIDLVLNEFTPTEQDRAVIRNIEKASMAGEDPLVGLPFEDRLGRCYELAGRYIMDNPASTLVHGSIQGYGNPRIGHAWCVDADGEVFDGTAGRHWPSVEAYTEWANAEPVKEYEATDAMRLMVKHRHWGPWHDEPWGLKDASRTAATDEYYHGTAHPFRPGDVVVPASQLGEGTNYQPGVGSVDHIYLSDDLAQAYFFAVLAAGVRGLGRAYVFTVEPENVQDSQVYEDQEILADRAVILADVTDRAEEAFDEERDYWIATIKEMVPESSAHRFLKLLVDEPRPEGGWVREIRYDEYDEAHYEWNLAGALDIGEGTQVVIEQADPQDDYYWVVYIDGTEAAFGVKEDLEDAQREAELAWSQHKTGTRTAATRPAIVKALGEAGLSENVKVTKPRGQDKVYIHWQGDSPAEEESGHDLVERVLTDAGLYVARWGEDHSGFVVVMDEAPAAPSLPVGEYVYWRLHDPRRPYGEDPSSTLFHRDFDTNEVRYDESTRQKGYSAFDNPWHLFDYIREQGWQTEDMEVLAFMGFPESERGADGELLVSPVPGEEPVQTMTWDEFVEELRSTPMGDPPSWGQNVVPDWGDPEKFLSERPKHRLYQAAEVVRVPGPLIFCPECQALIRGIDCSQCKTASLKDVEEAGYCTDEWESWHQGQCGTYAVALMQLDPTLRLGGVDFSGEGWAGHFVAFDDQYAYDAAGRHALPYKGVHGDGDWLGDVGSPEDYGLPEDEHGPEGAEAAIERAMAHAKRNGILEGKHGPRQADLVDYKPERSLSDPTQTMRIDSLIPVEVVPYESVPFIDEMHAAIGADNDTPVEEYMGKRKEFFDGMPIFDVPVENLVVTQEVVNTARVEEIAGNPATGGTKPLQVVFYGGTYYLMNGHHRVAAEILSGNDTISAAVWEADAMAKAASDDTTGYTIANHEIPAELYPKSGRAPRFKSQESARSRAQQYADYGGYPVRVLRAFRRGNYEHYEAVETVQPRKQAGIHADERIQERLTDAGLQQRDIDKVYHVINALTRVIRGDTAVRILKLPRQVNESWGDRSNGNEVWAIYRDGDVKTVMLRRDTQPATPEALRVDNIQYIQPRVFEQELVPASRLALSDEETGEYQAHKTKVPHAHIPGTDEHYPYDKPEYDKSRWGEDYLVEKEKTGVRVAVRIDVVESPIEIPYLQVRAFDSERVVGTLDGPVFNNVLRIDQVFVEEEYRRQGIATQMLDAVREEYDIIDVEDNGNVTLEGQGFVESLGARGEYPEGAVCDYCGEDGRVREWGDGELAHQLCHAIARTKARGLEPSRVQLEPVRWPPEGVEVGLTSSKGQEPRFATDLEACPDCDYPVSPEDANCATCGEILVQ